MPEPRIASAIAMAAASDASFAVIRDAVHVGHSTGGGEVVHYIAGTRPAGGG